ncbi:VIT domain-containing protein [Candidatus Uabimicrobium sp. HlEnr_7]|uniref:VIT domain-containing protein n=1 Tax=Candidatus Uabimicrobium helgolandensis TaxID=3095367 RepID=UPI00355877D6
MPELLLQPQCETLENGTVVVIIKVVGTITKVNSEQLEKILLKYINEGQHYIVLDLIKLEEIDDIGVAIIVRWLSSCRERGGDIKIINSPTKIINFFDESGLGSLLKSLESKEQALQKISLAQPSPRKPSCYELLTNHPLKKNVHLSSVEINIEITDIISHTSLKQYYTNDEKFSIEAVYHFPCTSTVYEFIIETHSKILKGKIAEKAKAFSLYDNSISQEKSAYLLEEEEENTATIFVGNILPQEQVIVTIRSISELSWIDDKIELQVPTSLSPSYSSQKKTLKSLQKFVDSPYSKEATYKMSVEAKVAKNTIAAISCPSHKVEILQDEEYLTAKLQQQNALDRDFLLRLTPSKLHEPVCLVARHPNGVRALVARMYPQWNIWEKSCAKEIIFVVDCSDSMQGSSIAKAKEVLCRCIKSLNHEDLFNIISFGSIFSPYKPQSIEFSETNMRQALDHVNTINANLGNKEMLKVFEYICAKTSSLPRDVILITDGHSDDIDYVTQAVSDSNIRIFIFGVGYGANHDFVKRLAQKTRGMGEIVAPQEVPSDKVLRQLARISGPAIDNIHFKVEGIEIDYREIDPIFDGDSITIYARIYKGRVGNNAILSAKVEGQNIEWEANVVNLKQNKMIPTLWAADHCAFLNKEKNQQEICDIGQQFHILTSQTSFIAIEKRKRKTKQGMQPPKIREIAVQLTHGFRGISTTIQIPDPHESHLKDFFSTEDESIFPTKTSFDLTGGINLAGSLDSNVAPRLQRVSFPYIDRCTVCQRNLEFASVGNYKCVSCSSYMNIDTFGRKSIYARVDSHALDLRFPSHIVYKNAIIASITALAQHFEYSTAFCQEMTEVIDHVVVFINQQALNQNETFHLMAVADNREMILGFRCVNLFISGTSSVDPRLKAIARIVDRLEVFPIINREQLLKITKNKK